MPTIFYLDIEKIPAYSCIKKNIKISNTVLIYTPKLVEGSKGILVPGYI